MYEHFGYSKYRRVLEYYSGEEDAYGMYIMYVVVIIRYAETNASRCREKESDLRKGCMIHY